MLGSRQTGELPAAMTSQNDRPAPAPAESASRSAAEEAQRFRDFAEAASNWFWEMDSGLRFCWFSDSFERISGVPQSHLLGRSRRDMLALADPVTDEITSLQDWWDHIAVLEAHRPFRNFIHPRIHPDGHKVYLSISGKPIFDAAGRFAGYRGTGADITDRIEIERRLREAKEMAEVADRAKSRFLATMSHELRTPLNAIIGFAEIMDGQRFGPMGEPRYQGYARDILSSGRHLLAIINDILDLARLDAAQMELDDAWMPVEEVMDDAGRHIAPVAAAAGIRLRLVAPEAAAEVLADQRRMRQVLLNLLSNAVKFSPRGGVVTLAWRPDGPRGPALVVTDPGPGMTEDEIRQAVEPFSQIAHHRTRHHEGTGLGLSLARRLCELHGARLELESAPGEGLTASIVLPGNRVRRGNA